MKLYLKNVRGSYTDSLFTAKAVKGKDGSTSAEKYSLASIIIPGKTEGFAGDAHPESPAGQAKGYKFGDPLQAASVAISDAAQKKWGDAPTESVDAAGNKVMLPRWQAMLAQLKATNRLPIHDGAEKAMTPGYAGNKFMNANNAIRPQVRHSNGAQLEARDGVIYSGCFLDVVTDIWAQDNAHGKRVNASLLAVQFRADGERLAGGATATDDDYAAIPQQAQEAAKASGTGAASLFQV